MSDAIRHRFTSGLLLALAALLAIVALRIVSYQNTARLIQVNRQVKTTEQMIGELRGLLAAIEHAESGQDTYLISGEDRDLEPYRAARQAVEQHVAALRPLMDGDPALQSQLQILEPQVHSRLELLDKVVHLRQASGFDAAAKAALQGRGRQSLEGIRTLVGQLDDAENNVLQHATEEVAIEVRHDFQLFLTFSFLDGALLIAGYLLLRHYIHQRDRAEVQMRLAKEAAEKANQSKDQFVAMVSHDLRSPLNSIGLWLTLLHRDDLPPEDFREALEGIERAVANQTRLVNDLLDVSRIVHGKFHVERKPIDLIPILSTAAASVRAAAESKHIALDIESSVGSFPILGDAGRLQQVAWNLLSNAVKFTPQGGWVRLRVREAPGGVEFEVADSGKGMPAEFLPRAFDRFSQSPSTGEQGKRGLGLGLAIVKHIVERHDGSVAAASPGEGKGSTFTVRLPGLGAADAGAGRDIPSAGTSASLPAIAKQG